MARTTSVRCSYASATRSPRRQRLGAKTGQHLAQALLKPRCGCFARRSASYANNWPLSGLPPGGPHRLRGTTKTYPSDLQETPMERRPGHPPPRYAIPPPAGMAAAGGRHRGCADPAREAVDGGPLRARARHAQCIRVPMSVPMRCTQRLTRAKSVRQTGLRVSLSLSFEDGTEEEENRDSARTFRQRAGTGGAAGGGSTYRPLLSSAAPYPMYPYPPNLCFCLHLRWGTPLGTLTRMVRCYCTQASRNLLFQSRVCTLRVA